MIHQYLFIFSLFSSIFSHHFTIFHTNDVHGWINGHPKIPNLDATYADYHNMLHHLKKAQDKDNTVFAFDSGDLTQGTGLSDATDIAGEFIFEMHKKMDIDASTIGNHELYDNEVINYIADKVYPYMNKTYISGNVEYKNDSKTLADPWLVKKVDGIGNILILGFMYNFSGFGSDCVVTPVATALSDPKYAEIIKETDPALIIGVIHSPPLADETATIRSTLLKLTNDQVPIILLCGHDHKEYSDITAIHGTFESLSFFQMLSDIQFDLIPTASLTDTNLQKFMSTDGVYLSNPTRSKITRSNSYSIHNLTVSHLNTTISHLQTRANVSATSWDTDKGKEIREAIKAKAKELRLDTPLGCATKTYYGFFKMPEETKTNISMYTMYVDHIYPTMRPLSKHNSKYGRAATSLPDTVYPINSASVRNHLYRGKIYRDDVFSVEPFKNNFNAIRNISINHMRKLINYKADPEAVYTMQSNQLNTCWKKCIPLDQVSNYQSKYDRMKTMQFRGGETERNAEIERLMSRVKKTLARCWSSEVSITESEFMQGCVDQAGVCALFDDCYNDLSHFIENPSIFTNKYKSFNSSFKITTFNLPEEGKETEKEKMHKFDIVTNSYDANRLCQMLNEIIEDGTKYTVEPSTIVCRDVFEEYISKHMKCGRLSGYVIFGLVALSTVLVLTMIVVIIVICCVRKKKKQDKNDHVAAVDDLLDDRVKYNRVSFD